MFFEGPGYYLRPKGAVKSALGQTNTIWGEFVTCLSGGGIIGVDCNGNTTNGVRYDSPTWGGFSVSGGFGEDDYKDVAVKYAADWNNFKVSAAFGFTNMTDENYILSGGGLNGIHLNVNLYQARRLRHACAVGLVRLRHVLGRGCRWHARLDRQGHDPVQPDDA